MGNQETVLENSRNLYLFRICENPKLFLVKELYIRRSLTKTMTIYISSVLVL